MHIEGAVEILKNGGIGVFPTDTQYGLGGVYDNPAVIERILRLKRRTNDQFTLIASSQEQVEHYFSLEPTAKKLAQQYWPGPLSLVVSAKFSVRVPNHPLCRELAKRVGKPIIATSANLSGNLPTYTMQDAQKELGIDAIDFWIDGGTLPPSLPSTVVRVSGESIEIIRPGAISL